MLTWSKPQPHRSMVKGSHWARRFVLDSCTRPLLFLEREYMNMILNFKSLSHLFCRRQPVPRAGGERGRSLRLTPDESVRVPAPGRGPGGHLARLADLSLSRRPRIAGAPPESASRAGKPGDGRERRRCFHSSPVRRHARRRRLPPHAPRRASLARPTRPSCRSRIFSARGRPQPS